MSSTKMKKVKKLLISFLNGAIKASLLALIQDKDRSDSIWQAGVPLTRLHLPDLWMADRLLFAEFVENSIFYISGMQCHRW